METTLVCEEENMVIWLCKKYLLKQRGKAAEMESRYVERAKTVQNIFKAHKDITKAILRCQQTAEAYTMCIDLISRDIVDLRCSTGTYINIDIVPTASQLRDPDSIIYKVMLTGIFPIKIDIK